MLQTIVNLLLCKCCKRKSKVYASKTKDMETQTEVSIDIEIYSEDFEKDCYILDDYLAKFHTI